MHNTKRVLRSSKEVLRTGITEKGIEIDSFLYAVLALYRLHNPDTQSSTHDPSFTHTAVLCVIYLGPSHFLDAMLVLLKMRSEWFPPIILV